MKILIATDGSDFSNEAIKKCSQIINKGFSGEFWTKLRHLEEKRKEFTLLESERQELISRAEALETVNLERMKALIELATIRQIDIDILMTQLGLNN